MCKNRTKLKLCRMAKWMLTGLLFVLLMAGVNPANAKAATKVPTEKQAYKAIYSLKAEYPEGKKWTNDNYYQWNGGFYSGGYGCAGFAFLCSDAAFGTLPARFISDITIRDIHVGDILRINSDTHSVVVLKVKTKSVVVVEGNYNSSIHWERELGEETIKAATYLITRYPEGHFSAKKQRITVSEKCQGTVYYKESGLKKKSKAFSIAASAKGKISYKVKEGSSRNISVSKKGRVTLKAGCKKGTYKVSVIAAATEDGKYKKTTKVITIVVK